VADIAVSLFVVSLAALVAIAYTARVRLNGAAHFARVQSAGRSLLLGQSAMVASYWALSPVGRRLVRWGVSANAVTAWSLVLGLGAGVELGMGHFGIAAGFSALSSICDALDGFVARETKTASDAGETFDAAVDRYVEFFFFGGLIFHFRSSAAWVALVLLALVGSFMVSYGTAKAEALRVDAPRGAMRRPERAAYLTLGALLVPLSSALLAPEMTTAPLALALALVAVVANVSAVGRLVRIAEAARKRESTRDASPLPAIQASGGEALHSPRGRANPLSHASESP
jgi:CDP-diacylglycerol--glycerol-3-phosphate 3-phosphatidyltransferase